MSKEEAVDELAAVLDEPDCFAAIVDLLEPSVVKKMLQLWGRYHGLYPPRPVEPVTEDDRHYLERLAATRHTER